MKKGGNVCERCKKQDTEVGAITYYMDSRDGYKALLCSKCINRREKPYKEICPKCKRLAYKHGGLTYYNDWDTDESNDLEVIVDDNSDSFYDFDLNEEKSPLDGELLCLECYEKKVAKVIKIRKFKLTIKNFVKDHWKFWISISISIIAVAIALSRL